MEEKVSTNAPKYAWFWIRLVAMIIDGIILGIIGYLLFWSEAANVSDGSVNISFDGWRILVPIIYTIGFWIWKSATPGKMALGLIITDEKGKPLDWKKAILRYIWYIISAIVFCIGFIRVAFDAKKQGWHDKIAKTYVVKKKKK